MNQFHVKPGFPPRVYIFNGERNTTTVNTGDPNYFVGEALIALLEKDQAQPAIAKSLAAATQ